MDRHPDRQTESVVDNNRPWARRRDQCKDKPLGRVDKQLLTWLRRLCLLGLSVGRM